MTAARDAALDWRSALGLTGLIAWLFMFGVAEYSHDKLMADRESPWALAYEVAAGYVLGFIAALAVWMLLQLAQGPVPELISDALWVRWLVAAGLLAVLASALAGLVMHNLGGLTLTYDVAFAFAVLVVAFCVVPLYRRWRE
jgi:hypothetical protein